MITGLTERANSLRAHLVTGVSLLLTLYLTFSSAIPNRTAVSPVFEDLLKLQERLGTGATLAIATFASLMLGSLVHNAFLDRVLEAIERRFAAPDWDTYVAQAAQRSRKYEEYSIWQGQKHQGWSEAFQVPSSTEANRLASILRDRQTSRDDARFRLGAALVLWLPALVLAVRGGGFWWLSLLAIGIFLVDASMLHGRADTHMVEQELQALSTDREKAAAALAKATDGEAEASAKLSLREIDAQIEQVTLHRFRRDVDLQPRCSGCGKRHAAGHAHR